MSKSPKPRRSTSSGQQTLSPFLLAPSMPGKPLLHVMPTSTGHHRTRGEAAAKFYRSKDSQPKNNPRGGPHVFADRWPAHRHGVVC